MFHYKGTFRPTQRPNLKKEKVVVIAGGTGLIGLKMARKFYFEGWKVVILTRDTSKQG